jgi:hypothetical protein
VDVRGAARVVAGVERVEGDLAVLIGELHPAQVGVPDRVLGALVGVDAERVRLPDIDGGVPELPVAPASNKPALLEPSSARLPRRVKKNRSSVSDMAALISERAGTSCTQATVMNLCLRRKTSVGALYRPCTPGDTSDRLDIEHASKTSCQRRAEAA